jgi:hypothetical protein
MNNAHRAGLETLKAIFSLNLLYLNTIALPFADDFNLLTSSQAQKVQVFVHQGGVLCCCQV